MKKKELKHAAKKVPRQIKDFIPQSMMKHLHQMDHIVTLNNNPGKTYVEILSPSHILPEWTYQNVEEVNAEIYQDETDDLFEDPDHKEFCANLPLSLIKTTENEFQWDRPNIYVINYYIDKEIQQLYPKKNYTSMRDDIKKSFYNKTQNESENSEDDENNIDNYLKNDAESVKQTIYKDFYKYLEKAYDFKVVNCTSRIETDEEYIQRKLEEEKEKEKEKNKNKQKSQKPLKGSKGTIQIKADLNDKQQVLIPQPRQFTLLNFKQGNIFYNSAFSWYTSIFQMILDQNITDISTHKSIINNIYPQKDGAPIYNPKGKYIIKLYLMGKPRKVVIDDRIPCTQDHEFLFPQSTEIEEIWAPLMSKALLKLNSYKFRHPAYYLNEEFMDSHSIYSLTGFHSNIIDIDSSVLSLFKNQFKLEPHEDDEDNYYYCLFKSYRTSQMEDKTTYEDKISEYKKKKQKKEGKINFNFESSQFSKKRRASNDISKDKIITKKPEWNSGLVAKQPIKKTLLHSGSIKFERRNMKFTTIIEKRELNEVRHVQIKESKLITDNKIIVNFLYSVTDFFENLNFNMKRLTPLDFSDLQKQLHDKKILYKQLPVNEKKLYLQSRRDLMKNQIEEKNQRLRDYQEKGTSYTLIKIISQALFLPVYEGSNEFSESKIIWAKKCLINNWDYPPVSYFSGFFNEMKRLQEEQAKLFAQTAPKTEKHSSSSLLIKGLKNHCAFLWTEEAYTQLIGDLDKYNTEIEPRKTAIDGYWLTYPELIQSFNRLIIIQNQNKLFHHKIYSDNSWNYSNTDVFESVEDYNAFMFKNDSIENKNDKYSIMIVFQPYSEYLSTKEKRIEIYPYITFDLIDINTKQKIRENVILNKFYSVYIIQDIDGNCEYGLIITRGTHPMGYIMEIMSQEHTIINMTTNDYLRQVYQYQYFNFKIDHPAIDPNAFWVIARIMVSPNLEGEDSNIGSCSFKINQKYAIKYIKLNVKMYLHNASSQEKRELVFDNFINLNEEETKEVYYITLSINSEYKMKEGTFEIEILYDNKNIHFEQIEHIEPYFIIDKYIPNKNKCVFSEYLYPSDKISCSMRIKLKHCVFEETQKQNEVKKGKNANSNSINEQNNNNILAFSEGKDPKFKTRLILELYHLTKEPSLDFIYDSLKCSYSNKGELLYSWDFYNEITITHLNLEGDFIQSILEQNSKKKAINNKKEAKDQCLNQQSPPQNFPYLLICYFSNEVNDKIISNASGDLGWCIEVFSSDLIGFVKDTSKEEHEVKLKEGWEDGELGRALRASRSRQKFLIYEKKKKGVQIQKEEEELLNEERERKFSSSANEETQKDNKSQIAIQKRMRGTNSKDKKMTLKKQPDKSILEKTCQDIEESKSMSMKNILDHPTPKLGSSKSEFVFKYVQYSNIERTRIRNYSNHAQIASSDYRDNLRQSILSNYDQSEKQYKNNSLVSFINRKKVDFNETLKSFSRSLSTMRMSRRNNHDAIYSNRNNIQQDYQKKFEIEKRTKEILNDGSQKNNDLSSVILLYKDAQNILSEDNPLLKQLFNYVSLQKEESIKNDLKKLSQKDQNQVVKILEDISYNKWEISEDVLSRLKGLLK